MSDTTSIALIDLEAMVRSRRNQAVGLASSAKHSGDREQQVAWNHSTIAFGEVLLKITELRAIKAAPIPTTAGEATPSHAAIAESQAIAAQYLSLSENGRRHLRALMDSLVKLDTKA